MSAVMFWNVCMLLSPVVQIMNQYRTEKALYFTRYGYAVTWLLQCALSIFSLLLLTRWLHFEKIINALLSKPKPDYYLSITKLRTLAKEKCFIHDKKEFTTMVNFYHDLGIIIKHRSTVILSTQWLINLFGQLITIPDFTKMVRNGF